MSYSENAAQAFVVIIFVVAPVFIHLQRELLHIFLYKQRKCNKFLWPLGSEWKK